jgi:hemerythrin
LRIDTQHKHLFKLASDAVRLKNGPDKAELQEFLFKLYAYVEYHFKEEEELMAKAGYSKLVEHADAHQAIIHEMNLAMKTSRSLGALTDKTCEIMGTWVTEHILKVDSELKTCKK